MAGHARAAGGPPPAQHVTPHPLLGVLLAAARGDFPAVDGGCTVLPPLADGLECSIAFTGHAYVATALPTETVLARDPHGFGGAASPDFLRWLAGPDGWIGALDATLVTVGRGGGGLPPRGDVD